MTIRLRPHHLLCLLTFAGKGYSPDFVARFEKIASRIAAENELVEIVSGPDDICAALLADPACHCRDANIAERDRLASEAVSELLDQPVEAGAKLQLGRKILDSLRQAFAAGTIRQACCGCQWSPLCDAIARNGFAETKILGDEPETEIVY